MSAAPLVDLICPLDGQTLQRQGNCWLCPSNHSFDIAKQGYVNLLPVQHKNSKDPGDSKEMVIARRDFLQLGHYLPIAQQLTKVVEQFAKTDVVTCLDAGCGEGYYLHALASSCALSLQLAGVDISKWAIQAASKANKNVTWIVGSNANLPVPDASLDFIFCLFGFPIYPEFYRALKPQGKLLMVDPTAQHLIELREQLYPQLLEKIRTEKPDPDGFTTLDVHALEQSFYLDNNLHIQQLALMTPHWFKAGPQGRERLAQLDQLTVSLAVELRVLEKH